MFIFAFPSGKGDHVVVDEASPKTENTSSVSAQSADPPSPRGRLRRSAILLNFVVTTPANQNSKY